MNETSDELSALIADTLAWCQAFAGAGGRVLPTGPLAELPPAEPSPAVVAGTAGSPGSSASARPMVRPADPPPRVAPPRMEAPRVDPPRAEAPRLEPTRAEPPRAPRPEPPRTEVPRAATPAIPTPVAAAPKPEGLGGKWAAFLRDPQTAVDEVWAEVGDCRRCGRCDTRRKLIRGVGAPQADVLVVTDPPTAESEQRGAALTQKEAEMLANMAQKVIGRSPSELYVVPALFCASPGAPTASEVAACRPQLLRLIETIRPRAILALGDVAASVLLDRPSRGAWGAVAEIPVMPTWHPSWLEAHPTDKRAALEHLQALRRRLDR